MLVAILFLTDKQPGVYACGITRNGVDGNVDYWVFPSEENLGYSYCGCFLTVAASRDMLSHRDK